LQREPSFATLRAPDTGTRQLYLPWRASLALEDFRRYYANTDGSAMAPDHKANSRRCKIGSSDTSYSVIDVKFVKKICS
jgi:hypothetical protein